MQRPQSNEYAPYYETYIQKFPEGDLIQLLQTVNMQSLATLRQITEAGGNATYQEGKWTVKQLLQHIIDAERIMCYRALRIARNDQTPLAGFEENDYAAAVDVSNVRLLDLTAEWHMLRLTTIQLFSRFTEAESMRMGTANGNPVSVRALAFIILGHEIHHLQIIRERYMPVVVELE